MGFVWKGGGGQLYVKTDYLHFVCGWGLGLLGVVRRGCGFCLEKGGGGGIVCSIDSIETHCTMNLRV